MAVIKTGESNGCRQKTGSESLFCGRLKLEIHSANITSDAGLLVYRELDEALEWQLFVIRKSVN